MKTFTSLLTVLSALFCGAAAAEEEYAIDDGAQSLVASGARIHKVGTGYGFTEGGARDTEGNLYFTDIPNSRVYKWHAATGEITLFLENTNRANGTWVDVKGNLIVCQHRSRQLLSIAPDGTQTVVVDQYDGKKLNSPNDLWMDSRGGIYFTDPRYGKVRDDMEYGGEFVFYLTPDRSKTMRVEDSLTRPNGVIGTGDGKTLYIADNAAKVTFAYDIQADGSLANKRVFANEGSDGMALDDRGNVYLTTDTVRIFTAKGELLGSIKVEKNPANVAFGGKDGKTLFITARDSVYTLKMKVSGVGSN